ncbi:MAG: hypothetical protein R3E79_04565 [Caldilineaceae bacterium]
MPNLLLYTVIIHGTKEEQNGYIWSIKTHLSQTTGGTQQHDSIGGCVASPAAPNAASSGDAAASTGAAQESRTVSLMNWDEIGGTPFETVINAYQEASGVTAEVQPSPAQDYEAKMRTVDCRWHRKPDIMH